MKTELRNKQKKKEKKVANIAEQYNSAL